MEEEKEEKFKFHYFTSQDLDPQNYVKVFDWKEKLNLNFIKVKSDLKYFDNCYYRIHKEFDYIEWKQKSDDENIDLEKRVGRRLKYPTIQSIIFSDILSIEMNARQLLIQSIQATMQCI